VLSNDIAAYLGLVSFEYFSPTNLTDDPYTAVHLKDLHLALKRYPTTVKVDGCPLINFQRYLKFVDHVNEVVHYKPPDLERYQKSSRLDYLEEQLRKLQMSPTSDDALMARSETLEAREKLDFKTRKHHLKVLGFKT
jgi:son of sevenless-like protein